MHTNDVLTGLRLYLCVKLDTLFTNRHANSLPAHTRTERQARIIPSDAPYLCVPIRVGARWGTPRMTALEAKMSLFWAIFGNANCFSRSFSATAGQTGPLRACHNTTQQALSTQLYSFASTPSLPDLDEKSKSRLSLRGVVRRASTHVYVRCMRASTLLITTVRRERVALCQ